MSERLPYEESLNQQLNDLPVPDEQKSWEQMEKLLDEGDDDRVVPPVFLRGCLGWGLVGLLALVALWFVVRPERRWLNHWGSASTTEQGSKPGAPVPPAAPQPADAIDPKTNDTSSATASGSPASPAHVQTGQPVSAGKINEHPLNTPGTTTSSAYDASENNGGSPTAGSLSAPGMKGKENITSRTAGHGQDNRRKAVSVPHRGTAGGDTVLIRKGHRAFISPENMTHTKGRNSSDQANGGKNKTGKSGVKNSSSRTGATGTNFGKPRVRNDIPQMRTNQRTADNLKRTDSLKNRDLLRQADSLKKADRLRTENIKRSDSLKRIDSLKQIVNLKQTDSLKKIDSLKNLVKLQPKDSSAVKPAKPDLKKSYYLSAGIGLQQQIPIAGAQATPYNYYGRKGSLADYIPSVYLRLHREERWFIQGEFRYGAPQLVKEFTYSTQSRNDSGQTRVLTTSLRLKKTFYHQLPLSFNYYVLPNWSVGTGIMYSRFRGAITEQQVSRNDLITQRDTILVKRVIKVPASSDSFFTRSQVNILFQTEYTWRRLSLSLRYTKGLQPFIRYTDPGGQQREQKAQSFEALLRFRLWRSKKK